MRWNFRLVEIIAKHVHRDQVAYQFTTMKPVTNLYPNLLRSMMRARRVVMKLIEDPATAIPASVLQRASTNVD